MINLKLAAILASPLLLVISTPVSAEELKMTRKLGFYAGAGIGIANHANLSPSPGETDRQLITAGYSTSATTLDQTQVGGKVYFGFDLSEYVAVEGAYAHFAPLEANLDATIGGVSVKADADLRAQGISVAGVAKLPLDDNTQVFAKAGLFAWHAETDTTATALGLSLTSNDSATGVSLLVGAGGEIHLNDKVGFRVEYEHYNNVGDADKTGRIDINMVSGGVNYHF